MEILLETNNSTKEIFMNISRRNGKSGMTIIEILIVVALLGILAGVLIRSLAGSQTMAKQASTRLYAETSLKTILLSFHATRHDWPANAVALVGAGLIADPDELQTPFGAGTTYRWAPDGNNVCIWTKFGEAPGDNAVGVDKNNGLVFTLTPGGKMTDVTPPPK
jgi:prepilin-type N-terminal cleavage/methylation domain-containing protein